MTDWAEWPKTGRR